MERQPPGRYEDVDIYGERCRSFIPGPLPPTPPLEKDAELEDLTHGALLELGRLDSLATLLPDASLFLYAYVRKEAVLSSQIEGTQSSLSDFLLYETDETIGVPLEDVQEVSNYVAALEHGLSRLREGVPLGRRLIREIHAILLRKGRGSQKRPGRFRSEPVWVGGSRPRNAVFVPPPSRVVPQCMADLERFLRDEPQRTPALIKAALSHVQFETIHPFLDGNGRIGRLLITLLLRAEGVLKQPLLYLSLHFKAHREQYYECLQLVRLHGDWETWLWFFVNGVRETGASAVETAQDLLRLFELDRRAIQEGAGRKAGSVLSVHGALQKRPLTTAGQVAELTGLSFATVSSALQTLRTLGIVQEVTGRQRDRRFAYAEYVRILNEGTEL